MDSRDTKIALTAAAVAKMERDRAKRGGEDGKHRQGSPMRLIFGIFPLLVIPVILYNLIALVGGGSVETTNAAGQLISSVQAPINGLLNERFLGLPMISGVEWVLTKGDAIVLLAVTFLFLEILKSTSTGTAALRRRTASAFHAGPSSLSARSDSRNSSARAASLPMAMASSILAKLMVVMSFMSGVMRMSEGLRVFTWSSTLRVVRKPMV